MRVEGEDVVSSVECGLRVKMWLGECGLRVWSVAKTLRTYPEYPDIQKGIRILSL